MVREGYILDFISKKEVKATPEEIDAVQVLSKILGSIKMFSIFFYKNKKKLSKSMIQNHQFAAAPFTLLVLNYNLNKYFRFFSFKACCFKEV